jgi:hypothetical protein
VLLDVLAITRRGEVSAMEIVHLRGGSARDCAAVGLTTYFDRYEQVLADWTAARTAQQLKWAALNLTRHAPMMHEPLHRDHCGAAAVDVASKASRLSLGLTPHCGPKILHSGASGSVADKERTTWSAIYFATTLEREVGVIALPPHE